MSVTYCRLKGMMRRIVTAAAAICVVAGSAVAQKHYVYFPSARIDDGRFLSMAGTGLNTLNEDIVLKIASRGTSSSIEVGVFDGNTGGQWDMGTVQMVYALYADPNGNGTGTELIAQWSGADMPDNDWFSATVQNVAAARGGNGDYFYKFVVHNPSPEVANTWSNFKLRVDGTLVTMIDRPFAYTAPLNSLVDAKIIYPSYPSLSSTTYDGSWSFFLNLKLPKTSLTIWDGDMDYGSYDCAYNDDDDLDTPNDAKPSWVIATEAKTEGTATSSLPCKDAAGTATGGTTTANPADDAQNIAVRRSPNVTYEVITPNGTSFANTNPSGNMEWEQFTISTAPFDRATMDHHADNLPAGVYQVKISGVDMANLNAWRFPLEALGVDSTGAPVLPIVADFNDGAVAGTIYYESTGNNVQDAGEPGIPSITVSLAADYNADGVADATFSTETDNNGTYAFNALKGGTYTVAVDLGTLSDDCAAVCDADGTATPSTVTCSLTLAARTQTKCFGYKRINSAGTRTRGYWVNHPENWPVTSLRLGDVYYSKNEAIGILQRPTRGDRTYALAAQLIATKLNLADGCDASCIATEVAAADEWLTTYRLGSNVKNNATCDALQKKLDDYNNGRLCVGHVN